MDWSSLQCAELIGAIGHHHYFLSNTAARTRLKRFCREIQNDGQEAFLQREYPAFSDKAVILNQIGKRVFVVDGNAHLLALLLCCATLTVGCLQRIHPTLFRFWRNGWEDGSGQSAAYDTYIPRSINASRLAGARQGMDGFQSPPSPIWVIPSNIPFDTKALKPEDRGYPLGETATALAKQNLGF